MSLESLASSLSRLEQMVSGMETALKKAESSPKKGRKIAPQMDLFAGPLTPPLVSSPALDIAEMSHRLEAAIMNIEKVLQADLAAAPKGKVSHG